MSDPHLCFSQSQSAERRYRIFEGVVKHNVFPIYMPPVKNHGYEIGILTLDEECTCNLVSYRMPSTRPVPHFWRIQPKKTY